MEKRLKIFMFFVLAILTGIPAMAQVRLTGDVVDENSEPAIGATVKIKGGKVGAITDIDGKFTLDCKKGDILEISYIGYDTQDVTVTGPAVHVVLKQDSKTLDELVVVGYGVQKKSDVTGAIASVKADDLENRTSNNLQNALQGKAAGAQLYSTSAAPGASGSIQIRGFSSNGASTPLYVVDGLRTTDISTLDPNSIESMEILKDAASAAIYGAEAGNGVIMITTKKGKQKNGTISYDFMYASESLAHTPELMNAREYREYMTEGWDMGDIINKYYDGTTDTDWSKVGFENGAMYRHNLSFSNSTDKSNTFIALSHLSDDGIVTGDKDTYKRTTLTLNADLKLTKWLTVGTNNNLARVSSKSGSTGTSASDNTSIFSDVMQMDPLTPVYMTYEQLPANARTDIDNGLNYLKGSNGLYYSISPYGDLATVNPLIHIAARNANGRTYSVDGTTYANIMPFKGFSFTSRWGYHYSNIYNHSWNEIYKATSLANATDTNISSSNISNFYFQIENFINYLFDIHKDHHFTVMLGQSYSKNEYSGVSGTAQNATQNAPNFQYLDYAASDATKTVGGHDGISSVKESWYGRVSYDYLNKYMLQFSLRADAADLSQLSQDKRWGYFPAVSAGWEVTKENWFPKNTPVDYLKVRGSWGQNGSLSNLGNYSWSTAINVIGHYPFSSSNLYTNASAPSSLGNKDLKWETSEQVDFGLDLHMFNGRFTFGMDYYKKKTKDLIVSGIIPSLTAGNTASPVNSGNVENKGFEFEATWRDNIGDFKYSVTGNLSTLKNKVTYLNNTINRITQDGYGNKYQTCFEVGHPVWYLRGYKFTGVDATTGEPTFADVNGNGMFDADDMTEIGSGIPSLTYGLTLNAAYKGFDLTVFGNGSHGADIMNVMTQIDRAGGNRLEVFYKNRWTADNTHSKWPKPNATRESEFIHSSGVVFSGDYFKIKQIQLGYTLPNSLIHKIGLSRVRAYISLDDFFTFTSYPGMDPEVCGSIGVDNGQFPTSKKVVFGLNLSL